MPPIAVALSGGVDSLVAAYLLKGQGHELTGFHFLTGFESPRHLLPDVPGCSPPGAIPPLHAGDVTQRIAALGRQLGIPVHVLDCSKAFEERVVGYFRRTYLAGMTPNPCLVCNAAIKFGTLLDAARRAGARCLATGHYARVQRDVGGNFRLLRGRDTSKDQSYFLARLSPAQLAAARFPLGEMTKEQVRALARAKGLQPLAPSESQDACFVAEKRYTEFLARQGVGDRRGPIENLAGEVIGQHHGLHRFTVGQRRGINCPAREPYYVVKIDPRRNRLIVGARFDLMASRCRVTDINWIQPVGKEPLACQVKVRYRHVAAAAVLTPLGGSEALLEFDTPQSALTPGQGAVFYNRDTVIGGGWIAATR